MCRLFGYSKQAYFKRLSSCRSDYDRDKVRHLVMNIRSELPRLGTRKLYHLMKEDLKTEAIKLGRDRLFDFLREEHLLIGKRKRYTKTTHSKHWMRKYPNLTKELQLTRPEQLWVADITYLNTKNGNEYLHLITDAYSKQIMGYELSSDLRACSTTKALRRALKNRKYNHSLIHHSDRGLQYCSSEYTQVLKSNNISISMTEQYAPYENAVAERVNGILKDEFGLDRLFRSNKELHQQLQESIYAYNHIRPHLSLHMMTPIKAHDQSNVTIKKWSKEKPSSKQPDGHLNSNLNI